MGMKPRTKRKSEWFWVTRSAQDTYPRRWPSKCKPIRWHYQHGWTGEWFYAWKQSGDGFPDLLPDVNLFPLTSKDIPTDKPVKVRFWTEIVDE